MHFLKKSTLSLIVFAVTSSALAISESNWSVEYAAVKAYTLANSVDGSFKGEKNKTIAYRVYAKAASRANIVLLPGFNESYKKYDELAYDLRDSGYGIYIMDHRGQGFSEHLLPKPNDHLADIDDFQFFIKDVKNFVSNIVPQDKPKFLLAHSMGGAIASLYLETYPDDFKAAVLNSPMLAANYHQDRRLTPLLPPYVGYMIMRYGLNSKAPENPNGPPQPVTNSAVRENKNNQIQFDNPQIILRGKSLSWVMNTLRLSGDARFFSYPLWIHTPILMLEAGSDKIVFPDDERVFCQHLKNGCELKIFPAAEHEILQEVDSIRNPAIRDILDFFAKH